ERGQLSAYCVCTVESEFTIEAAMRHYRQILPHLVPIIREANVHRSSLLAGSDCGAGTGRTHRTERFRKRQSFIAGQRLDIAALVQYDTVPRSDRNSNFIVSSEIAIQTDRPQIIVNDCEQSCVVHLKLKLLAKLSAQCCDFVLSIVDAATEQAPMAGVPNIRNVIAQLHYVAAILEHEECCDGVAGPQREPRC